MCVISQQCIQNHISMKKKNPYKKHVYGLEDKRKFLKTIALSKHFASYSITRNKRYTIVVLRSIAIHGWLVVCVCVCVFVCFICLRASINQHLMTFLYFQHNNCRHIHSRDIPCCKTYIHVNQ